MISRWRALLIGGAIVGVAIAVYVPGLPGEFVYDDHRLIVENDGLKRPIDLRRSFLQDYYASDIDRMGLGYYRPVALLSNELDYRRGGGGPTAFHATNIIVHALCTVMVMLLAMRVFGAAGPAPFAAGLLFALHPVHAESVAFISGRVDPLATLFGLGAVSCHLAANRSSRPALWRVGVGVSWLLALMSKEVAFTIPVVAFLLESAEEGWPGLRALFERVSRYLPYAMAWLVYLPLRFAALSTLLPPSPRAASLAPLRPPVVVGSYLAWLLLPPPGVHLEPALATGWPAALAALLAVAAGVGAVVAWRRGGRLEGALLGACLVTLLPVAQLKPLETELSERFLYLPSVASAILMGAIVRRLPRGRMTLVALGVVAALAAAEASILIPRARMWRDEVALWEARERESGRSLKASLNLAHAYARRGDRERAVRAYETAEEIEPSLAAGLSAEISALSSDVGSAEYERGLLKSLAELPRDGALWNNLGFHLYRKGDLSGAKDAFAKSIELTPSRGASWLGLAMTRLAGGEVAEADDAAAHALLLEPDLALAAALRAECALRSGRPCDAVAMASAIVLDDPSERAMLERIVSQAQERCRR